MARRPDEGAVPIHEEDDGDNAIVFETRNTSAQKSKQTATRKPSQSQENAIDLVAGSGRFGSTFAVKVQKARGDHIEVEDPDSTITVTDARPRAMVPPTTPKSANRKASPKKPAAQRPSERDNESDTYLSDGSTPPSQAKAPPKRRRVATKAPVSPSKKTSSAKSAVQQSTKAGSSSNSKSTEPTELKSSKNLTPNCLLRRE